MFIIIEYFFLYPYFGHHNNTKTYAAKNYYSHSFFVPLSFFLLFFFGVEHNETYYVSIAREVNFFSTLT